jgi:hypothetical protein
MLVANILVAALDNKLLFFVHCRSSKLAGVRVEKNYSSRLAICTVSVKKKARNVSMLVASSSKKPTVKKKSRVAPPPPKKKRLLLLMLITADELAKPS